MRATELQDHMSTVGTDNLFEAAQQCLACSEPARKLALTHAVAVAMAADELDIGERPMPAPIGIPGRPMRPQLR